MSSTKTNATVTVKPTTSGFRLIFRGKNKAGKYMRAVRTVQAPTQEAAYAMLAEVGTEVAKEVPFEVGYTNVFAPLSALVPVAEAA